MVKSFFLRLFSIAVALVIHAGFIAYLNYSQKEQVSSGLVASNTLSLSFSFSSPLVQTAEASVNKAPIDQPVIETKPRVHPVVRKPEAIESVTLQQKKTTETKQGSAPLKTVDKQSSQHPIDEPETLAADHPKETNSAESEEQVAEHLQEDDPINHTVQTAETADEPSTESASASQSAAVSQQTGMHQEIILDPQFKSPPQSPVYPRLARKRGQEGIVWLDVWLDSRGEQTRLEVYDSSGISSLDRAAVEAVSEWQFLPKRKAGLTVASRVRIPVHFVLN